MTRLRAAIAGDRAFLERMFVEAALWRPEWPRVPLAVLVERPELARYFSDWGRAGDAALIAERDGQAIGAAWFRRFTADEPGYGFVRDDVPEIGLAVVDRWRGQGIGWRLVEGLQALAAERGHAGLSLSVHPDNPALRLYESLGFTPLRAEPSAVTMFWTPTPQRYR